MEMPRFVVALISSAIWQRKKRQERNKENPEQINVNISQMRDMEKKQNPEGIYFTETDIVFVILAE